MNAQKRWVQQLTGDDSSYLPNGKLFCLWKYKKLETVHQGKWVTKFDWQLGRYEPSSPSTKELHDRSVPRYLEQLQKHPKTKKNKEEIDD